MVGSGTTGATVATGAARINNQEDRRLVSCQKMAVKQLKLAAGFLLDKAVYVPYAFHVFSHILPTIIWGSMVNHIPKVPLPENTFRQISGALNQRQLEINGGVNYTSPTTSTHDINIKLPSQYINSCGVQGKKVREYSWLIDNYDSIRRSCVNAQREIEKDISSRMNDLSEQLSLCGDKMMKLSGAQLACTQMLNETTQQTLAIGSNISAAIENYTSMVNKTITSSMSEIIDLADSGYQDRVNQSPIIIDLMGYLFAVKCVCQMINHINKDNDASNLKKMVDITLGTLLGVSLFPLMILTSNTAMDVFCEWTVPKDHFQDGFAGFESAKDDFKLIASPIAVMFFIKFLGEDIRGKTSFHRLADFTSEITSFVARHAQKPSNSTGSLNQLERGDTVAREEEAELDEEQGLRISRILEYVKQSWFEGIKGKLTNIFRVNRYNSVPNNIEPTENQN
ncbi:MAG: hypothetical protein ACON35_02650 [Candidatus Marinamargulisbacteria bacterium]